MTRPIPGWRILLIAAITAATVSFHYGLLVPDSHGGVLHAIHGRLCYIPIILAAVWYGVRGGLITALAITALTLPYARMRGITDPHTLLGEYTEMVFYVAIGLMTGVLIERQWRERRRSESLQRELARQEHLSSLGQMAAGLAHEIRNPLGAIQGAAEILADRAQAGTREEELFDVMRKESRRLGAVVDDFLGFARPRPLQLAPLDVAAALERAASQMELDASARAIAISRSVEPRLPVLEADAGQLHQVLLNLLLNAVAATADGGRVALSAADAQRNGRRCVALRVRDAGPGIPADVLPRIFDPFFTTRESGTGLGLSISHGIIREHGGWIDVESHPGAGTTVSVILPAKA
ncbi:MAG: ATP-binding protein [Candidatus Krumholzibacteria bacterium]|nr:ATP-binding protein [Candidatus Krumholzibacteria bacterium]MDH5271150.1 ATP-binding protein [Candidatus Krumholzibacteria bacterium]